MNSEIKKALGQLLLMIVGAIGVLMAAILPELTLSGPMLVFLMTVAGAATLFFRKLISILTGVPIGESDENGTESETNTGTG